MDVKYIQGIFHAALHTHNKQLDFPSNKLTVTEFTRANKVVLKKIITELAIRYGVNLQLEGYKYFMRKGTEDYLKVENVWQAEPTPPPMILPPKRKHRTDDDYTYQPEPPGPLFNDIREESYDQDNGHV